MSDLINRQQAIDALRKLSQADGYINLPHEYVTDAIRGLPTAQPEILACGSGELVTQPEIIRCKDCKHWERTWTTIEGFHYCPNVDGQREGEYYCADAEERRTDE